VIRFLENWWFAIMGLPLSVGLPALFVITLLRHGVNYPVEEVPPGWYQDPRGLDRRRWWNGVQWTHWISDETHETPRRRSDSVRV
jgi:hypothetical protein